MLIKTLIFSLSCVLTLASCDDGQISQLTDISTECQLLILEKLNLRNLLSLAQTSKHFKHLAAETFRHNFPATLKIESSPDQLVKFEVFQTHITVYDVPTASALLFSFGDILQNIKLGVLKPLDQQQIIKNINDNCGESLRTLWMMKFDDRILRMFKNPMLNVDELILDGLMTSTLRNFFDFIRKPVKVNQIFPNITKLHLNHDPVELISVNFPHLEHLIITSPARTESVRILFENNPQIRRMDLYRCVSLNALKWAGEHLPELEQLHVQLIHDQFESDGVIELPKVKKMFISWRGQSIQQKIILEQLEELEIICSRQSCVDFVMQNKNVRKLHIEGELIRERDILNITRNLQNLDAFFVATTFRVDVDEIREQVRRESGVMDFQVKVIALDHWLDGL